MESTRHGPLRLARDSELLREYLHRMRNRVNVPIMRAMLLQQESRKSRAQAVAVRAKARAARAG